MVGVERSQLVLDVDGPRYHHVRNPDREEYGIAVRILCDGTPVWTRFLVGYARFDPHRRNKLGELGAYVPTAPPDEAVEAAIREAEALIARYSSVAPGARVMVPLRVGAKQVRVPAVVLSLHLQDRRALVRLELEGQPDFLSWLYPDERLPVALDRVLPPGT